MTQKVQNDHTWKREIDRRKRLRLPAPRLDYRPADERVKDFEEACLGFNAETAILEATRCIQCPTPQGCVLACPLHNDIPSAMWAIHEGQFLEAARIYRQTSNFPELCGRLCPDEVLCAGSCGIGKSFPAMRMGRLEAFVADLHREREGLPVPKSIASTGRKVAVVGAGPAGLTVAEELAGLGHSVTMIEKHHSPGGMLVYSIPQFRVPVSLIDEKVKQLQRMGVSFVLGTILGEDVSLDDLIGNGYQAVFLGTGAGHERIPDIPGSDLQNVYSATEFLRRTNRDPAFIPREERRPVEIGERVTVFGGGHAAVDCARVAIRLGAKEVTCYTPTPEMDLDCRQEDIFAAREERVNFVELTQPVEIMGNEVGQATHVLCQELRLRGRGRQRQVIAGDAALFPVDTDLVILAPEVRRIDEAILKAIPGLEVDPEGWIITDLETGETSRKGVFAAGDNTGETQLASMAIARGRKVAGAMHAYLT